MLHITLNYQEKSIPIIIKKCTTSKKISLKACFQIHGGKVTIPKYLSFNRGKQFAEQNLPELYSILKKNPRTTIKQLKEINLLGKNLQIEQYFNINTKNIEIKLTNKELIIIGNIEDINKLNQVFKKFVINHTKKYFKNILDNKTQKLGITYNKISIKNLTSKWGSCSILKNINLNWRLAFAPKKVINYVIMHELAHLVYFNHSKDFWNLVNKLHPTYKEEKLWLKKYGHTLYQIQI